jgi:hypothetical protein
MQLDKQNIVCTLYNSIIVWKRYKDCIIIIYLNICVRFGSVMLENLLSRGCLLSGVKACRDKELATSIKFSQINQ